MKLHKLNARGVAHEFLVVGVLVVFSIVGIGYVVAGNANPSDGKAASGVTQVSSGGTRTITVNGIELSCELNDFPTPLTYGQKVRPYVKVTNNGSTTFKGTYDKTLNWFATGRKQVGAAGGGGNISITIKKGKSVKVPLTTISKVPYASTKKDGKVEGHYWLKIGDSYCATQWFDLPKNPKAPVKAPASKPKNTGGGGGLSGGGEG